MIHQFYFTHCTYASSALERKSGEVALHPLGYSARAASIQGNALREVFRKLERYVYYYLPSDTPAREKETYTATTAPQRLIYLPETECGTVLMNLCYRQKDTAGRVGSYFCHAISSGTGANSQEGKIPFSAQNALQLWDATNWVREDTTWFTYDIPVLNSLTELLGSTPVAIDEKTFVSFLTTEPGGDFHDARGVIPERWRKMLVSERQHYFKTILYGYLSTCDNAGESVLLVAEPSVAALLFYGICLFFPQTVVRNVSFSTYEPQPEKTFTKLAATTLTEPAQNDLNESVYHGRSFVINTWNGRTSEYDATMMSESYVSHVWKQFQAGGVSQVATFCKTFSSVGVTTMLDLKAMMDVENVYHQMMVDGEARKAKPLPTSFAELPIASSRMAVTLLKRRLAEGFTKVMALPLPEVEKALSRIVGTPGQLLLLELLGTGGNLPEVQKAVLILTQNLPEKSVADWLKISSASDDFKAQILERWLLKTHTLPPKCDFLWPLALEEIQTNSGEIPSGPKPPTPNANILPTLFCRQKPEVLLACLKSSAVMPYQKEMLLTYTLGVSRLVEREGALNENVQKIRKNLDDFVRNLPETLFNDVYHSYGNWFFVNYPGDSLFLGEKFTSLEDSIFRKSSEISAKLDILFDIQDILPAGVATRVRRWGALRKALQAVSTFQSQPGRKMQPRALDQACELMAQKAYDVFDDVRLFAQFGGPEATDYSRLGKITNAQRNCLVEQELILLGAIAQQWNGNKLLPAGNKTHDLMLRKVKYYLQTQNWNTTKVGALGNKAVILAVLAGVGLGLLILFVCMFFLLEKNGKEENRDATATEVVTDSNNSNGDNSDTDNGVKRKNKGKKAHKKEKSSTTANSQSLVAQKDENVEEYFDDDPPHESLPGNVALDEEQEALSNAEGNDDNTDGDTDDNTDDNTDGDTELAPGDDLKNYDDTGRYKKTANRVKKSPLLPGKKFAKTPLDTLETWDEELVANRFLRRATIATKATQAYTKTLVVLESEESIRNAGGFSENDTRSMKLVMGYVLFDGTAYPFGGTEDCPNCVAKPQEVTADEETTLAGTNEPKNAKKPSQKRHVLTEGQLMRPQLPDEPGKSYYVPELAEALGLEAVMVEMTESPKKGTSLQIRVKCKDSEENTTEGREKNTLRWFRGCDITNVPSVQLPTVVAVFSSDNFSFDVPLPERAQDALRPDKLPTTMPAQDGLFIDVPDEGEQQEEEAQEVVDPDPFGEHAQIPSTGLQPFPKTLTPESVGEHVGLLREGDDFELKVQARPIKKGETTVNVRLFTRMKGTNVPGPYTAKMMVREVIPGEPASVDQSPLLMQEGENVTLSPRSETKYFLVSFHIQRNDDASGKIFVTPYYQYMLDGEKAKRYELILSLTKEFHQQFRDPPKRLKR